MKFSEVATLSHSKPCLCVCNAKVNWEQNGSGLSAPIKNKSRRLLHSHRTKQTLYLKVLLISANWEQVIIPKRSTTIGLFQAAPIIKDSFLFLPKLEMHDFAVASQRLTRPLKYPHRSLTVHF